MTIYPAILKFVKTISDLNPITAKENTLAMAIGHSFAKSIVKNNTVRARRAATALKSFAKVTGDMGIDETLIDLL